MIEPTYGDFETVGAWQTGIYNHRDPHEVEFVGKVLLPACTDVKQISLIAIMDAISTGRTIRKRDAILDL